MCCKRTVNSLHVPWMNKKIYIWHIWLTHIAYFNLWMDDDWKKHAWTWFLLDEPKYQPRVSIILLYKCFCMTLGESEEERERDFHSSWHIHVDGLGLSDRLASCLCSKLKLKSKLKSQTACDQMEQRFSYCGCVLSKSFHRSKWAALQTMYNIVQRRWSWRAHA